MVLPLIIGGIVLLAGGSVLGFSLGGGAKEVTKTSKNLLITTALVTGTVVAFKYAPEIKALIK